ncbi:ATP-binding cassette sub-family A member 17 isoform X2 [Drosophila biarmipes]|uniref:ATP-binding cassette sub-family A member 17 isoform X2 n=1 Tax=Drosophila biarmipes TaxID=125945 RepID=UPI0007E7C630|nr:ATP-binding cassette sub-family A member 17 isoform X2 [Drosophila biarmipes]
MTVRDYIRKFILINKKNHMLQLANPLELLVIVLLPPLFIFVSVLLRFIVPVDPRSDRVFSPIDFDRSWMETVERLEKARKVADEHNIKVNPFTPHLVIGWAPKGYVVFQSIMRMMQSQIDPMTSVSFDNCEILRSEMIENSLFAGLCFDGSPFTKDQKFEEGTFRTQEKVIPILNYTIMLPSELRMMDGDFHKSNWLTLNKEDPLSFLLDRLNQPYEGGFVGYVREGFIRLQKSVTEAFLDLISRKTLPAIHLRRFPLTARKQDPLMYVLDFGMPILIIIGFLFPTQIFIWVVSEKQSQVRQFLINMNIGNLIHFLSWYLKGLIYMMISSVIIVVLLKIRWNDDNGVLTQTPWYVLIVVLFCYNCASLAFALMVGSFFRNALNAVRVLTILWLVTYLPIVVLWNNPEGYVQAVRYISYVLPNVVITLVFESLIQRESVVHVSWEDHDYKINYFQGSITVASSSWVFMVNALVYFGIGLYVDGWRASDGSGKKMKKPATNTSVQDDPYRDRADSFAQQGQAIGVNSTKIYEVEPSHRRFKLKIKKLCKRFRANDRPALNLFSWNVYENEVTVLMGHNGCGKTTLLKILAGLLEPTRGTVMISTYNIQTERKAASMELGIAFGSEMLLDGFSVIDYLRFICRVKGLHNSIEIDGQANYFLNILQIGDLKAKRIRTLSDRDLSLVSICSAFVGNSPIVLIDDIHSDLDKRTQMMVWNLINEEKSKRTIILVSNSPPLAENIADRMAIMSNGELKCTGTKPFLKNMYGHGYRLTCVKGNNCNMEELYILMNSYIPNMSVERHIGYKITFVLENRYEDLFPILIEDLENNMQRLGVVSFRIRDTSMEEIFLRFGCEENDQSGGFQSPENAQVLMEEYYMTLAEANEKVVRTGWKLFFLQGRAIFYKRWMAAYRHWIIFIFEVFTQVFIVVISFCTLIVYGKNFQLEPLTFNLSQLTTVDAFVELFSEEVDVKEMHAYYTELLYWYDAHLTMLTKNHRNDYALLTQSDFTSRVNGAQIFGATFDKDIVTAWFNNVPLHTAPYALNVVHNAVARKLIDEEATIDVTLQPLPFQTSINMFPPCNHTFGNFLAFTSSMVLSFIWPAFVVYLIGERGSSMRKQQLLAGARACSYWVFTFLFDVFFLLVYSVCTVSTVAIYMNPYHDGELYVILLITLMLGGIWVTLLVYLISGLCKNPFYGFLWLCGINYLGFIFFSVQFRRGTDNIGLELGFFTMYMVCVTIVKAFAIFERKVICKDPIVNFTSVEVFKCKSDPNCCIEVDYTTPGGGISEEVAILFALIIAVAILVFISEYYYIVGFGRCRKASKTAVQRDRNKDSVFPGHMSQDSAVIAEKCRASHLTEEERKHYAAVGVGIVTMNRRVRVLNDLDFSVAKSECLSISGANNSGKSTLVKLVASEAKLKSGQIWIKGHSMHLNRVQCYRRVGYCPQRDNLPAEYTPRDLLYIHALTRGHRHRMARELSESLLRMLGLTPCWNRSVRLCTSGQIRRLYFGYAILGSPDFICVDGVPAGLDPTGKQIVLMMTATLQTMGCSFLYTTLTGLDSERLCQRTPLLLEGQLWTMDSVNAQDENYKSGYQLEVRFKRKVNPNVSLSRTTWNLINHFPMSPNKKFSAFMEIKFPEATLKVEREDSMVFQIPVGTTTFAEIFLTLRKDAFEMNVDDYYITRNLRMGFQIFTIDQFHDNSP